ncbi:hypothetical protein AVEN_166564-1 [Araneus ventricosus]|uniref:Uncharacterized protein n=1 Tax=Araneus ventricosus TaxID=182803 RepID=A0A4Y2L0L1_ARAVE|nr:hypothetical protein AVEN_166564-1 [Araneus ventricosus]
MRSSYDSRGNSREERIGGACRPIHSPGLVVTKDSIQGVMNIYSVLGWYSVVLEPQMLATPLAKTQIMNCYPGDIASGITQSDGRARCQRKYLSRNTAGTNVDVWCIDF